MNDRRTFDIELVETLCSISGSGGMLGDLRTGMPRRGLLRAVERHDDRPIVNWLMDVVSYQGISDTVAHGYLEAHGRIRATDIEGKWEGE